MNRVYTATLSLLLVAAGLTACGGSEDPNQRVIEEITRIGLEESEDSVITCGLATSQSRNALVALANDTFETLFARFDPATISEGDELAFLRDFNPDTYDPDLAAEWYIDYLIEWCSE